MLYWSDYQVAKAIHKEHEQIAQQNWLVKQAFASSNGTYTFLNRFSRLLTSLKRVFRVFRHEGR